jgi:hypothetical protein
MEKWCEMRESYASWLRDFSLMESIGKAGYAVEIIPIADEPVYLNAAFWSERTHELETIARACLSDSEIDFIFDAVAAVIDENLRRFDPLVAYYAGFFSIGDPQRLDAEREAAHSAKRDLAWAAIERVVARPGFFTDLLAWYERGRWPCDWSGDYPDGHVLAL